MCTNLSNSIEVSLLLEFASTDDVASFDKFVDSRTIDAPAEWYGRSAGDNRQMSVHDRTPLMIAALYGSTAVVEYILNHPAAPADVNRRSVSDGATALHLAAAGGAPSSPAIMKMLIDASADVGIRDASGQRPGDVIARHSTGRILETLLKSPASPPPVRVSSPETPKSEKKEYPVDVTLPDIKNGIYGTDEFRMYTFKVKPCSRAYSHDWTECPFVHPGENARRRDPAKYLYSCVPCPEFRKGSCRNGDSCEYAHGVFECWLHPAQYRTRLCKDEVGCNRRVCFFAHKTEELRLVNPTAASVGGMLLSSPRSALGVSSLDMATALLMSSSMSPSAANLQLPASRLKSSSNARDRFDSVLDLEFMGLTGSPRGNWAASRASDYSNRFGSPEPTVRSQFATNQYPSSPSGMNCSSFGLDNSMAKAVMNARSAAFANRSQSFSDRSAVARQPIGTTDWGSRDGKLDWGIRGEELHKLKKSLSFGFRSNQGSGFGVGSTSPPKPKPVRNEEPDLSWVQSMVKDGPAVIAPQKPKQYQMNGNMYAESEMVV